MSLACLLLVVAQSPDFSAAMQRVGEGRFDAAHVLIDGLDDPVERSQAQVFLRLRAGDLPGALHWATQGTLLAPDDLWLAERRASIAVSMGAHKLAERAVEDYSEALLRAGAESSPASLVSLNDELERMRSAKSEREAALLRSRVTVLASLAALLGLLFKLTRK